MPYDIISYFKSLNPADYILIGAIGFIWLFRFLYDILFYGRLAFRKVAPAGSSSLPFTVFIVERNEEERLKSNLPEWLQMGYPHYEVLVVDDYSEDNSTATLALLKNDFPRLRFTALSQETRYSDKLARNLALKAASHEMVVMIHPAMVPPDYHWLPGVSAAVSSGKDVVIGYCNLLPRQDFSHKLYRVESFFQQIESMACSISGMPYVTAEENVAFRKSAYFEMGGLAGKIREEYLNLEMVVNEIVKPGNVAVLPVGNLTLRKDLDVDDSMLRDLFSKSFRLRQYLKRGTRFFLGLSRLTRMLLFPLLLLLIILYPGLLLVVAGLFLIKSITYSLIIKRLQKRLHEPKLFVTSLLYAIVAPYYRFVAQWRFNLIRKNRR
jgi:glycosyltransferase involved in cell wall biosynthesis